MVQINKGMGTRVCRYLARDVLAFSLHSLVLAAPKRKRFYVWVFGVVLSCTFLACS